MRIAYDHNSKYMTNEQLLAEVEYLLRSMPPRETLRHETEENLTWLGRLSAVIEKWDLPKSISLHVAISHLHGHTSHEANRGFRQLMILLRQAQHDLQMETLGPISVAVPRGNVYEYFDEIRKIIEGAKEDLLFVDPYLDAGFVSRYLAHVTPGVAIRLLTRHKLAALLPAVEVYTKQNQVRIEVRSEPNFHDRYLFIDKIACYQSGASFKDGDSAPCMVAESLILIRVHPRPSAGESLTAACTLRMRRSDERYG